MTKIKKQLRAEAVERLWNGEMHHKTFERDIVDALIGSRYGMSALDVVKAICDLLTDDANDDSTPEKVVRAASADANDVKVSTMPLKMPSEIEWHYTDGGEYVQELTGDSREKLEADVRKHYSHTTSTLMYPPSANKQTDWLASMPMDTVFGWLDRQAAITQHEITERWAEHLHPMERECGDLRRKVDELTAERDEIAELVGWHGEADGNSGRPLLVPMVAAMCEGSDVAAKLRVRVEGLCVERDYWKEQFMHCLTVAIRQERGDVLDRLMSYPRPADLIEPYQLVTDEVYTLRDFLAESEKERELYRKKQDECDELQAQADEKWNLYVAEHRRADINAADREMYREATSALVDSITDGLRKVNSILDGKDEGLA